ncbi:MAG: DUF4412 domain-containing protein [Thermoanaerobaculum sp.]|nr:DUF4412 domain-containing protein [Thermoanaerobaculum sp.]
MRAGPMTMAAWAVWVALSTGATAGVYYEAKTTAEGKGADYQRASVKAWVSGDKAKVVFEQSGNPMVETGAYLITTDGGENLFMVNPKDKTYSKWDLDAMVQMVGGLNQMMNIQIKELNVQQLEERPGGVVAGIPTKYYKFRTTYRQTMKFMMMNRDDQIEEVRELWVAPELVERGLGIYLRAKPPKTVDEGFNRLMELEFEKVKGVPLKMVTVTTTRDKKGATEVRTVTMEVTKLQVMPVPDETFSIPSGYKEVQLLPTGEGEAGQENPMGKLFGGNKKQ